MEPPSRQDVFGVILALAKEVCNGESTSGVELAETAQFWLISRHFNPLLVQRRRFSLNLQLTSLFRRNAPFGVCG